jgi:hypothetical protein
MEPSHGERLLIMSNPAQQKTISMAVTDRE